MSAVHYDSYTDVLYRDAKTHWAENIGTTVIDVIVVELKVAKPADTH